MRGLIPGESLAHISGFGLSNKAMLAADVRITTEKRSLGLYQPDLVTNVSGYSFVSPLAAQARNHDLQHAINQRVNLFIAHSQGAVVLEQALSVAMGSEKAQPDQQLVLLAPSLSSPIARLESAVDHEPSPHEQRLAADFGGVAMILQGIDNGPRIAVTEDYVDEIIDPGYDPIQAVGQLANRFSNVFVVFAGCDTRLGGQEAELTLLKQQIDHPVQSIVVPGAVHTFRNKGLQVIDGIASGEIYRSSQVEIWQPQRLAA